jgi:hypothetical protein
MRSFITFTVDQIIRMMKSRQMRWTGHAARTGRGMHIGFWWESQKESDHYEDLLQVGR